MAVSSSPDGKTTWSFGFGSNMNVEFVEKKKGYKVYESTPGIVRDWRMGFYLKAMKFVEPAFATVIPMPGSELHGVAIRISLEDAAKLSQQERSYDEKEIEITAYDGRILRGYMYVSRRFESEEFTPSKRYLGILVAGARAAGLSREYISKLESTPTYTPSADTLLVRQSLPAPHTLPAMTVADLAATKSIVYEQGTTPMCFVSVLGYICRLPASRCPFETHKGRDITARQKRQWNGVSLDMNDDLGQPPFPELNDDEREFVSNWLDQYLDAAGGAAGVVGYLAEYLQQFA